ncbi:hypothetical protein HY993_03890 [Candidatus Micrarchaeota archaeon]|nr:hypothetical protein [Candidatus Micrarchaeota archaeon]
MNVVLDTNFLLLPIEKKLDVYEKIPLLFDDAVAFYTPRQCFDELMAKREEKKFGAALELARKKIRVVLVLSQKPDDAVVEACREYKAVAATNDRQLREKLKKAGVKTIFLRGNKLEIG